MSELGIFVAQEKAETGEVVSFFGCNDASLLEQLYAKGAAVVGQPLTRFNPKDGMRVKKVGEITVVAQEDPSVYIVSVDKAEGDRKPTGEVGDWLIQSVVFSKDKFTEEQCKKWIADSEGFGNHGIDETDTAYRFRQYDPESFSAFRMTSLADGVSAVYGRIGTPASAEEAEKAAQHSMEQFNAVRKINESIIKQGVRILCSTATSTITKADDGKEEEERFVLSMVLEPTDGTDGAEFKPDTQNDVYSAQDIRKACHTWMENYGSVDLMHNWKAIGKQDVRTLECYIAPVSFTNGGDKVSKGSWMLGLRIANDELWKAIKSGDIGAYSIGGTANRTPLENA